MYASTGPKLTLLFWFVLYTNKSLILFRVPLPGKWLSEFTPVQNQFGLCRLSECFLELASFL